MSAPDWSVATQPVARWPSPDEMGLPPQTGQDFHQMSGTPPGLLRSEAQLEFGVPAPDNPGADADGNQHHCDHNPGNIRHLFIPFARSGQS